MANVNVEYVDGMMIGKGFDSLTADVKVSPVVEGTVGAIPGAAGQSGSSHFMIINESKSFDKALNIDAEASHKGFAIRASAKFRHFAF